MSKKFLWFTVFAEILTIAATNIQTSVAASVKTKETATSTLECVWKVVEQRENVVSMARETFSSESKTLLDARKEGLRQAWTITNVKSRRDVLKKVWVDFKTGLKTSRKKMRDAVNAAWTNFSTGRKSCGGNIAADDVTTVKVDGDL